MKCLGAFCLGHRRGALWTLLEQKEHINVLELFAAKYAIPTFTRYRQYRCTAVPHENGGTHIIVLSELSKEIWDYLIENGVMNTAEYLPRAVNKEADFQS